MCFTIMSIKIGGTRLNISLAMNVFSFVDLFFIIDCSEDNGVAVVHDSTGLDLFSFVTGSGLGVYIRSLLVGLFRLVRHDAGGDCMTFYDRDEMIIVGVVCVRPGEKKDLFLELSKTLDSLDCLCGDFNARNILWELGLPSISGHACLRGKYL